MIYSFGHLAESSSAIKTKEVYDTVSFPLFPQKTDFLKENDHRSQAKDYPHTWISTALLFQSSSSVFRKATVY